MPQPGSTSGEHSAPAAGCFGRLALVLGCMGTGLQPVRAMMERCALSPGRIRFNEDDRMA
eukprot:7391293-Prymnesium_polylepis.2